MAEILNKFMEILNIIKLFYQIFYAYRSLPIK